MKKKAPVSKKKIEDFTFSDSEADSEEDVDMSRLVSDDEDDGGVLSEDDEEDFVVSDEEDSPVKSMCCCNS